MNSNYLEYEISLKTKKKKIAEEKQTIHQSPGLNIISR